jgi:phosphoribosylformylglycinamidine synthase
MLIDTYWSDHCRHTTFFTEITDVNFTGWPSAIASDIIKTHQDFQKKSKELGKGWNNLMEAATASARFLKEDPEFKWTEFLDISEEDNAASYKTQIELENGTTEDWIIMFKNETHNSPTEAEPFGWAATCLGGAIRDTLSGRSFTFWAMRVSGSKDPTEDISETMAWKLSQRAISIGAMLGYSSYGNQIGLATGRVREYFHPGYAAKRFECWYVVSAVKEDSLVREKPRSWDKVIVFGWPVGRDGVGWATTSSKVSWDVDSTQLGAHVQKWNPVEERKMQRLMLNSVFTKKVIKSNDFGAGGVSVALWEIAEGIDINLDEVAKHVKYKGLTDEELVISESQERMAIVVSAEDYDAVMEMIRAENIHAFHAGTVHTDDVNSETNRLNISLNGKSVVWLSRDFLDKNGATRKTQATVHTDGDFRFFDVPDYISSAIWDKRKTELDILSLHLKQLVHASQKWLGWNFDNSVWASTILAPYGWQYQNSPQVAMVQKIPTFDGIDSMTWVASTFAYNPELLSENTYMWGMYAIIETISKIIAVGWDYEKTWVSLQEYFGKLTDDEKWGEVYAWLLGTLKALTELKVAAIGWKDSMSGTHVSKDGERLDVPPSIVSFANSPVMTDNVVSAELQQPGNVLLHFPVPKLNGDLPDFEEYKNILQIIQELTLNQKALSSSVVEQSWVYWAVVNMMLGNRVWVEITKSDYSFFAPMLGDIILEVTPETVERDWLEKFVIGQTLSEPQLRIQGWDSVHISNLESILDKTLEWVFPSENKDIDLDAPWQNYIKFHRDRVSMETKEALKQNPKAIIPVFPGTNSELDTKHALIKSGFEVEEFVFYTNGTPEQFTQSRKQFSDMLDSQDLIVFPGGFSNGDEPDGSAKFIANIMRSPELRESFQSFIDRKWTITMGICNGFQALVKLGLFEESKIKDYLTQDDETLTYNTSMRHQTELVGMEVRSVLSSVLSPMKAWDRFIVPISNGEGRLIMPDRRFDQYTEAWQIPLVYVDENGNTTNKYNGSRGWAAALTSPDGRIFGLMPHPERTGLNVFKNVPGNHDMPIFEGIRDSIVGNK